MSEVAHTAQAPEADEADYGRTRQRGWLIASWVTAAILLLGAWFVVRMTPSAEQTQAPFEVNTTIGEWGTGRNIRARVVGSRFADALDEWDGPRPGNWLVVDVEAEAVTKADTLSAWLTIDGATYQSSERTVGTMFRSSLVPGLPTAGSLFFELPADTEPGSATVKMGLGLDRDPVLDSLIVVPIELDPTNRVPLVQPAFPVWATS